MDQSQKSEDTGCNLPHGLGEQISVLSNDSTAGTLNVTELS
jgi:hypothetical protein